MSNNIEVAQDALSRLQADHQAFKAKVKKSIQSQDIETVRNAATYFCALLEDQIEHSQNLDVIIDRLTETLRRK